MDPDEYGVVFFNLWKILLQLTELLLAVGSPRATAEEFHHDIFLAEKLGQTNFFAT